MDKELNISIASVLKIALVILGLWFLYIVRDAIFLLLISFILVTVIEPIVDRLGKWKIPRPLGILAVYIILFAIIGLFLSFFIPSVANELQELSQELPIFEKKIIDSLGAVSNFFGLYNINFNVQAFLENLSNSLVSSSGKLFSTTVGVFSGLLSVIVVMSLTFYMSLNKDGIKKFFVSITPAKNQEYVSSLVERIKLKIGRWMQGQLVLMAIIFLLDYLVLSILDVPFALILALLGGLLEIVPYLGPTLATIPAVLIGFLISPLTGVLVFIFYIAIQQAENHILTPQIMRRAVGLNPITVILALMVGGKLFGMVGIILAVPVATAIDVFLKDFMNDRNRLEEKKDNQSG